MTKFRNLIAIGAASAIVAVGYNAFTQDDLDALLQDLEKESAPAAEKPAADAPAVEPQQQAAPSEIEQPVVEPPAAEPEPVPAPEPEEPAVAEEPAPAPEPKEPAVAEEPAPAPEPEEPAVAEEPAPAPEPEEPAVAEEPAPALEPKEPAVAEEPAPAPEPEEPAVAEEPAPAPEPEEPAVAEEPAPAPEPKEIVTNVPAPQPIAEDTEENLSIIKRLVMEMESEDNRVQLQPRANAPASTATKAAVAAKPSSVATPAVSAPPAAPAHRFSGDDAEILSSAYETEVIRRHALREQAAREIAAARKALSEDGEYLDAVKHYRNASTYLGETPNAEKFKKECSEGIAHGYYLAALEEDRLGRRKHAMELMKKAKNHRHPKARRQLETWLAADDPDAAKTEVASIRHRINEKEYQMEREKNNARLKRARQFMATRELDKAMDECELVLRDDKYNEDAIALRSRIIKMQRKIQKKEQDSVHDGMISAVDKAWRPPYAINARDAKEANANVVLRRAEDDPRRILEKDIERRMKEMRLPEISFKPPATIADAVEFFKGASRDYDRPDKPLDQRGFNLSLKPPEALRNAAQQAQNQNAANDGFGSEEGLEAAPTAMPGLPVIPYISASDLSFYDALKYVCESVEYKFKIHGPMIIVMQKDMSIDEMVTRSYPVLGSFIERANSLSNDLKDMKPSNGFGGGNALATSGSDDSGDADSDQLKKFFADLGVKWPPNSTVKYIKALGRLRVKNTYENLAELEKTLQELNADPRLIEIEARFVEVCQEDLNSLGFEWILNSDYALGVGSHLARALRVRDGKFGTYSSTSTVNTTADPSTQQSSFGGTSVTGNGVSNVETGSSSTSGGNAIAAKAKSNGATWYRWGSSQHGKVGLNAINGESSYTTGQRWLSDLGNHVSGSETSNNDKFMRLNAFLGGVDLSMILHMLAQRSDTDLLSAPKVLTRPSEQAVMKVVTEYIYPTEYQVELTRDSYSRYNSSPQVAIVRPEAFTMREVGVILDATPSLTDDGNLIELALEARVIDEPTWKNYGMRIPYMSVASTVDFTGISSMFTTLTSFLTSLGKDLTQDMKDAFAESAVQQSMTALNNLSTSSENNITYYDAPMEQPFFHQRSVQSSVTVYPGATIVMGGLITEVRRAMDDKIPFLGDLPFIGRLFRSHAEQTTKRNLLIFVTTRLVDAHGREVAAGITTKEDRADEAPPAAVQPAPAAKEHP